MTYYKDFIVNNLNNPHQMKYEMENCLSKFPKYDIDKFIEYVRQKLT